MNYRHSFHAGNFADVCKHLILIALIQALQQKDKGCTFIDTHAGIGRYDFASEAAARSPEYREGVFKLYHSKRSTDAMFPPMRAYFDSLRAMQTEDRLRYYPGSPWLLAELARPQDKVILNEWHAADHVLLGQYMKGKPVQIHHRDAYECLPAILPPMPRRGLILIDPPYEAKDEFSKLIALLKQAEPRFPQGVYAIWYPIVQHQHEPFVRKLQALFKADVLVTEMVLAPVSAENGLRGTGMAIVHPPYQIEKMLTPMMRWLQDFFKINNGS